MEHSFERLYLAKGATKEQDIFVERCPVIQHQVDGIRFLFRALKKKKHGVILNDPSGYGKKVQTALFLGAILPTLDKPVLILCSEGMEQRWMEHFQEWTQVSDDVRIELSNPSAKKKVLISTTYGAAAFAKRAWSVLVVDAELLSKDVLTASLGAELRVWITSSNIKEDLTKLSTFCSWLKEPFDAERFKANPRDLRDVLSKAAMLDAFLEDTLKRRDCGEPPFTTTQVAITNTEPKSKPITMKNKDATGTKIKRSKKTIDSDNNKEQRKVATYKNRDTEEFEIGNICEEKLIKEDKPTINTNNTDFTMIDISACSIDEDFAPSTYKRTKKSRVLQWDSDSGSEKKPIVLQSDSDSGSEKKPIVLQSDSDSGSETAEIHETINSQFVENQSHKHSELDSSGESLVLRWDSETCSDNGHKDTSRLDINYKSKEQIPKLLTGNDVVADAKDDLKNSGSLLVDPQMSVQMLHENDNENEIMYIDSVENNNNANDDMYETNMNVEDKLATNPNDIIVEEKVNENNQSTESNKQDVLDKKPPENANLSSFELKIKQLEELTLKKFKGSFLDSIF